MQSASDLTKHLSQQMKTAYRARDAVSFTEAAHGLKSIAAEALASDFFARGSEALRELSERLSDVRGYKSHEGLRSGFTGCEVEFIEQIMPVFGVNSTEAFYNLGVSPAIDQYILSQKVDFSRLAPDHGFRSVMFACLRLGRVDDFLMGYKTACTELLRRQLVAWKLPADQKKESRCLEHSFQGELILVLRDAVNKEIPMFDLPEEFDRQLADCLSNLCQGDGATLEEATIMGMRLSGLRLSLGAAILNASSIGMDIEAEAVIENPTLDEAVHMLGVNCNGYSGPNLVANLAKYDAEEVATRFHSFAHKHSTCNPRFLFKSCAAFAKSDAFKQEHTDVVVALLENAALKLRKTLKPTEKDYEVLREQMTLAGIPERIQFKVGSIARRKGKILEMDLGI